MQINYYFIIQQYIIHNNNFIVVCKSAQKSRQIFFKPSINQRLLGQRMTKNWKRSFLIFHICDFKSWQNFLLYNLPNCKVGTWDCLKVIVRPLSKKNPRFTLCPHISISILRSVFVPNDIWRIWNQYLAHSGYFHDNYIDKICPYSCRPLSSYVNLSFYNALWHWELANGAPSIYVNYRFPSRRTRTRKIYWNDL